ncbi:hsp70-Hsp90 organizing protein 1-like isoform X2 [Salarias fasciatus]|uniref:hsp70-Hsp90 organizing protein 1-like isoform X2 n=1 Tax=Salarias fasciatus TaxID=181472 RepID=UPI0011768F2E|nr:hsp70-Hsp90 organizing protein 1-like isoform X2 [Salarias fasciatus]
MKFTRDICRLLGLGADGPGEKMEVQDGAPNSLDRRTDRGLSQDLLSSEDGLDEEKKNKKKTRRSRAEKRRDKRKRQKERRKLERRDGTADASQQDEEGIGAGSDGGSEDGMKEEDEKEEWTSAQRRTRSERQLTRSPEEEPEWDVSCAFVANAASSIKLKVLKSRTAQNKENESRGAQMESTEDMKRRGESLTAQGIQMFEQGQYNQAVDMFTEAMSWDPNDHRFYGNRSYCYWCLEQYSSALTDAQRSIQLAPHWPKGHFRKGCALMGLKRYSEAEQAMEQVLRLDPSCREASSKLFACRVLQLVAMGFEEEQSKHLLDKFNTIQAVVNSPEAKTRKTTSQQEHHGGCRSLWVGNVNVEVTEQDLKDLFRWFGEIECVRVLHERFCAFVDFKNANMAAKALEKLQGAELKSSKLVMRYPDRWTQRTPPSTQQTTSSLNPTADRTQTGFSATG